MYFWLEKRTLGIKPLGNMLQRYLFLVTKLFKTGKRNGFVELEPDSFTGVELVSGSFTSDKLAIVIRSVEAHFRRGTGSLLESLKQYTESRVY